MTDIVVRSNTSRSLMFSWTQPCHPNGIIINYRIEVKNWNDSLDNQQTYTNNKTLNTNNNSSSFNVTNLLPYRFYVFIVYTEVEGVNSSSAPTKSVPFQTGTEGKGSFGVFKKNFCCFLVVFFCFCFFFIQLVVIFAIVFIF